jgi:hypothetical protein
MYIVTELISFSTVEETFVICFPSNPLTSLFLIALTGQHPVAVQMDAEPVTGMVIVGIRV